jgi:hypothetical protein
MKRIGIYLDGELMAKFEHSQSGLRDAMKELNELYEETWMLHELKEFDDRSKK